jgi:hypothetical protein
MFNSYKATLDGAQLTFCTFALNWIRRLTEVNEQLEHNSVFQLPRKPSPAAEAGNGEGTTTDVIPNSNLGI